LHTITLEHNNIVEDDVLLVGHQDKGRGQQISKKVISSEAEEIQDAILEHLALIEAHANDLNKVVK
jgi:hypothetical protein